MLHATVYGKTIKANTLPELKRKASRIANGYFNTNDEMQVTDGKITLRMTRINRKSPNNEIIYGQWK